MAPDLKHPATGDLIVLADGEQLWRIGWPGAPVLVITKKGGGYDACALARSRQLSQPNPPHQE